MLLEQLYTEALISACTRFLQIFHLALVPGEEGLPQQASRNQEGRQVHWEIQKSVCLVFLNDYSLLYWTQYEM